MAAIAAIPPGYAIPEGVDVNTDAAVLAWAALLGAPYVEYAEALIDEGYDTLYNLTFDMDELIRVCPAVKRGHAIRLMTAAAKYAKF